MLRTLLISSLVSGLFSTSAFAATTQAVVMKSISFDPKVVTVHVGDSVEWKNKSLTPHSATANDASFDTGLIDPSKSTKKVTFEKVGRVLYHCSIHGKSMSGTIEVVQ